MEEEPNLTDLTLARPPPLTTITIDQQRAWHILSLLLQIGRPITPVSLSSLCTFFPADPHCVTHLCSIPNSPISLSSGSLVVPSLVALNALRNFASNFSGFAPRVELRVFRSGRFWEEALMTYSRRRKRVGLEFESVRVQKKRAILHDLDGNDENQIVADSTTGNSINFIKALSPVGGYMAKWNGKQARIENLESENVYRIVGRTPSSSNISSGQSGYEVKYISEHEPAHTSKCHNSLLNLRNSSNVSDIVTMQNMNFSMPYLEHFMHTTPAHESITRTETKMGDPNFERKTKFNAMICLEVEEQSRNLPIEAENACQVNNSGIVEDESVDNRKKEKTLVEATLGNTFDAVTCMEVAEQSRCPAVEAENVHHPWKPNNAKVVENVRAENCRTDNNLVETSRHEGEYKAFDTDKVAFLHEANGRNLCIDLIPFKGGDTTTVEKERKDRFATDKSSFRNNQPSKASARTKAFKTDALIPGQQAFCSISRSKGDNSFPSQERQCTRDKSTISMKQKVKQNHEGSMPSKRDHDNFQGKKKEPFATSLMNQPEPKPLPNFELYIVEEEEGSGGYGTVYRASRKSDGVTFAIKCPHEKANRHHVENELKMLERFGGKNSVIRYEGSFKCGGSECLVLEHVQHDKPEILKKEIEVSELLWYGYCMFRALSALHKQGIVHRDVKPGNFLFSRKIKQGYLIDFNLATDLHQKYGISDKAKVGYNVSSNHVPPVHPKTLPPANKMLLTSKPMEITSKNSIKVSNPRNLHNIQKEDAVGQKRTFSGQGADGSGVTSAKDATSTRIPSGEKSKEPIMVQGRKALVTFAHKARQSSGNETQTIPASKRKRVSALPRKVDKKHVCLTPMPLLSNGIEVAGSGLMKDKEGDRKQKKEGPCVGTKGFRAPEVLFRSAHQGPKIDVWSAGVTLLYLMTGRTPFTGEPEQNIKDIAKLRGSEDLWEVAKLHNRLSSFPAELHDVRFIPSVKLRDWCKQNTRRPEFFDEIPISLFDLVDKCLTVNPRSRLTAEEALRHEFFTACHVDLRRMRIRRKEPSSDSGISHLLQTQSETLECIS